MLSTSLVPRPTESLGTRLVKYLLSIFTADCLRHPIQMAGVETIIMGVAHSSCYKLLIPCFVCIKVVAFEFIVYLVGLLEITVQRETFVGENFRKLVDKRFSWRKLLQIAHWCHHKMPSPQIARRKLANSHKTSKLFFILFYLASVLEV